MSPAISEEEKLRYLKAFGEKIRQARITNGDSLKEADYSSSFDESNISKYEHGKRDLRLSTILNLAKMLKVHPKELFDFDVDFID